MGHDALIVGGGLVGLACAAAIADRGGRVLLLDSARPGGASAAGAGMLAPTVEGLVPAATPFAIAARERFPGYLDMLLERTGIDVPLNRAGILELGVEGDRPLAAPAHRLDAPELARAEPALAGASGAVLYPLDGAVDNVALLAALRALASRHGRIDREPAAVVRVELGPAGAAAHLAGGTARAGDAVVIAAGAWSARIDGLPRPLPVEPVRGQMIALASSALEHVVVGPEGYLVPRGDRVLVGATMEWVGYDPRTTPEAGDRLRRTATALCPALGEAAVVDHWAGLRPGTPDLLPIIGRGPEASHLLYASGHSRNGILMAPLTGDCVAALLAGEEPGHDLAPFSIERFGGR